MTARECPACAGPIPLGFGRPRTYCSTPCRQTVAGWRRELANLEEQAADARSKAESGYAPGAYFHEHMADLYAGQADELRQRIPEPVRW